MVNIIIGVVQVKVIRIGSKYLSRIKRIVQPGKLQEPSRVGIFWKIQIDRPKKGTNEYHKERIQLSELAKELSS